MNVGVLMAPVVPGITSHPHKLEQTVKAIADHGATFIGANLLHLEGGTRTHFLEYLAHDFPELRARYDGLYAAKYARRDYASQVYGVIALLKERYLLDRPPLGPRREPAPRPVEAPGTAQPRFDWSDE